MSGEIKYGGRCGICGEMVHKCDCLTTDHSSPVIVRPPTRDMKFDTGKPRWDLVQLDCIEEIAKVLTFGAEKYDTNSWQAVEGGEGRYFAALLRHLTAYHHGEVIDHESGLTHLSHAACNIMFLLYFQKKRQEEEVMNGSI